MHTNEVVERIISSVLPQKVSRNYFDERIKGKPDLYGPIWISVTLVGVIHNYDVFVGPKGYDASFISGFYYLGKFM